MTKSSKFINKILYDYINSNQLKEFENVMKEYDETDERFSLLSLMYYQLKKGYKKVIRLYQKLGITRYQHFEILIESAIQVDKLLTYDLFIRYSHLYESIKIGELIEKLITRDSYFTSLLNVLIDNSIYFENTHNFNIVNTVPDVYPNLTDCENTFNTVINQIEEYKIGEYLIVDCANILYTCGGAIDTGFNYLNRIVSSLPKDKQVILVMHTKYYKLYKLNNYKHCNSSVFETPYGENDDNYIILLSIHLKAVIITNDKFRDHIAKVDNDIFTEWINKNRISHSIKNGVVMCEKRSLNIVRYDGYNYYVPIKSINPPTQSHPQLFYKI